MMPLDKRTKAKVITTLVCMLLSLAALYAFLFVLDISRPWRTVLIMVALSWLVSGVMNLVEYLKKK